MKVVFLDIDGVLNSSHRWPLLESVDDIKGHKIDPLAVAQLNKIAAGCSVVVSSTWRILFTPNELREHLLRFGLDSTIPFIDSTAVGGRSPRGHKIKTWLEAHPEVTAFVVLDDSNDMDGVRHRFVKTTWKFGLLDGHVEMALRLLDKPKVI